MRIFGRLFTFGLLAVALLSTSCRNRDSREVMSEKTGWSYNDPESSFFNVNTQYHGKRPAGMLYIPVASSMVGKNTDLTSYQDNAQKKRVSPSGFYMDEFEVTNLNWREYVAWLHKYYVNDPLKALLALPDETVWRKQLAYNEPYVRDYYSHVAYSFYPVVGVTWQQATRYCNWRTDRLNELQLIKMGIINFRLPEDVAADLEFEPDSASKYIFTTDNARDFVFNNGGDNADAFDTNDDGYTDKEEYTVALDGALYDAEVRLPTEAEWEYAAFGVETHSNEYYDQHTYPWSGSQLRNLTDKKLMGDFQANFTRREGDQIGDMINSTFTLPVNYFAPNGYGLYNMIGNVNEWVADVYRSTQGAQEAMNPFRGNVFESDSAYAERIIKKNFYNLSDEKRTEMREALIKERGIANSGHDYRDFKDGDVRTSLNDSILNYRDATPIEQANMISNTARVYKGGGWNDRPLWLDPSHRRWLPEKRCLNNLGFRCVMNCVGGNEFDRY